jgi:hypothetical protein
MPKLISTIEIACVDAGFNQSSSFVVNRRKDGSVPH